METLELHGITFEFSTQNNKFCLLAKKAQSRVKYIFNYSFRSEEGRYNYFNKYISNLENSIKEKEERKEAEKQAIKAALSKVKPGDIFSSSWGYDQTNVDFYQVIEVKGCYAILKEIGQTRKKEGIYIDARKIFPVKDNFIGETIKKKIQTSGECIFFKINSFIYAYEYNIEKNKGENISIY